VSPVRNEDAARATERPRRVLMLVGKDVTHDARVRRSARSLVTEGYKVTIACKSADGQSSTVWDDDGFRVLSVPIRLPGPKAEELKGSLLDVHRERRRLAAALNGRPPSAEEQARLADLRRKEKILRRRYERLDMRARHPAQVDKTYQAAWTGVLRREAPDVIHVHDHHGLGTALSAKGGTRVIYDAHELETGKDLKAERRAAMREYLLKHVPKTDAVITVGSALADLLVADLGLSSKPTVVHNTPSLHAAKPAPYRLRAEIGIDPATPLLVYAGGFNRRRRLLTPIKALVSLPDVHLAVILVRDKGTRELAAAAERLGVGERVHFPPSVPFESVVPLIRTADVAIHPLEPSANADIAMPNKLFEYLQAGLPMVVSDCEQMASFVRKHGLGEVAPADDPRAWAGAIRRILADRKAYTVSRRVRRKLCDEWSWEAQERVLLELYATLLEPKDDAWYDHVYAGSEEYRKPYTQSMYYPCWASVADRLLGAGSVLEIGCGAGQFAALLRDRGVGRYLGIDFSRVAIDRAREVCPQFEFRVEDVRTSDVLERAPCDAVVCLETLEHVQDDRDVIRRLKPGTRFIGTVPNFPAKAHVRYFETEDEVARRYAPFLLDLRLERFVLNSKATLFIFDGVRNQAYVSAEPISSANPFD
jgi:glycosyltransferase involved in cell wall biosynthesis